MKNKILSITLAVFMVFASIVMPLTQVKAAGTEKTTVLTIHKLKYEGDLDNDKLIKNDGTEQTYDASYKPYDAEEYGKVGLTLYKLDKTKLIEKLKQENGDSKKVAADIANDIAGNTTNGTISKVEIEETFIEGKNPIQMTITTSGEVEYFLLVETTSPATVTLKSSPELLQFPTMSVDGKGYNLTPHLYLKSKIDETSRELEFTKVVEKINKGSTTSSSNVFKGAEFEVYKGEPGKGTKLVKEGNPIKLTSGEDGKFKLAGITVGNYYLVEIPTTLVDSNDTEVEKSTSKPFIVSPFAKNDSKNKFTFRMDEDGKLYRITKWEEGNPIINKESDVIEAGKFNTEITNLIKPSSSKKITSKTESIGYGDIIEYEIKVNLPSTLGQKSIADEKYEIIDTASEGVIIDESSIKIYDKDGKEVRKSKVTSESIKIEKIKDNQIKFTFSKNSFTPDKRGRVYGPFTIKYNAKISKDFVITEDKKITNKIEGEYTVDGNTYPDPEKPVDPEEPVNPDKPDEPNPIPEDDDKKEVEVTSYTKKFTKIDSGIFNWDVEKNPLKGAEFILGRKIGEKVEYRKEDTTDKYAWTETEDDAQVLKSREDGTFEAEGLAATTSEGVKITYFVKEIKAPQYYNLSEDDKDKIHEFSFDGTTNEMLKITNDKITGTPMTGYEKAAIKLGGLILVLLIATTAFAVTRFKRAKVNR